MRFFTLSPRLAAVAAYIPPEARFADIGTDHAKLPVWLAVKGRAADITASEVADEPLARAARNIARWGVGDRVRLIKSDGFRNIAPEDFTHAAICGMGGGTIAEILRAAPWTADGLHTLILQPASSAPDLRAFLYANGYTIRDEAALTDSGRVYTVMEVTGGADPNRTDPLRSLVSLPLSRRRDDSAREYFARVRRSLTRQLRGMPPDGGDARKTRELIEKLGVLEKN